MVVTRDGVSGRFAPSAHQDPDLDLDGKSTDDYWPRCECGVSLLDNAGMDGLCGHCVDAETESGVRCMCGELIGDEGCPACDRRDQDDDETEGTSR